MIFPKALNMSHQTHTAMQAMTTSELEVIGVLGTEFLALDEVAPGQEWDELLAASWGIPYVEAAAAPVPRSFSLKQMVVACWQTCFGWAFAA